ncbi:galectin [Plakobranchus ocellatus]|uniref:Galectin n=1 Tax=Plakobranchus ocellatus TaxID=259542 RepID=A0AAV4A9C9_9GAST|nr:galectin [Plakobranchus ocellatus]
MGNNIIVPYSSFIQGGVRDGTDVVISGRPSHNFNSFSINLCSGPNIDQGDVALHFNPRFNQGTVVRNHKQGNAWGAEETAGGMPFRRGHVFTMHMEVKNHGYKILVNNRHFCDFTHRMPKESVQYLYIVGDVTINFIQFRGGAGPQYPAGAIPPPSGPGYPAGAIPPPSGPGYPAGAVPGYPPAGAVPPYPGAVAGPIFNPMVPVNTPIQGGFYPGKIIYITGTPRPGASRFQVNLACGFMESSDLALHFDVRFQYGSDFNVVVRTHRTGGQYGAEEKQASYFPFFAGANFEMMLLCEQHCIKVAVNNQHFIEFNHRIQPIQRIDHVQIHGDVSISQIRFQ